MRLFYECAHGSFVSYKRGWRQLTIIVDDAGIGDLLFGVVIGAFRSETQEFRYDIVDVGYFRYPRFRSKEYLKQT
jgi:hypothetical protein